MLIDLAFLAVFGLLSNHSTQCFRIPNFYCIDLANDDPIGFFPQILNWDEDVLNVLKNIFCIATSAGSLLFFFPLG